METNVGNIIFQTLSYSTKDKTTWIADLQNTLFSNPNS